MAFTGGYLLFEEDNYRDVYCSLKSPETHRSVSYILLPNATSNPRSTNNFQLLPFGWRPVQ
ncbi:hypothetical protein SAMN05192553_10723 [Cyclobacterium xiamenense]|uniref:Uncharacterized protein n=1 Tax=Cyclobacterium xiamenense TaxID=1297121 RepID=A0A1H7AU48_9BACT|nr:hypothetical protein SAMN05192553_10723 [Cyclobacterium xiamenense]